MNKEYEILYFNGYNWDHLGFYENMVDVNEVLALNPDYTLKVHVVIPATEEYMKEKGDIAKINAGNAKVETAKVETEKVETKKAKKAKK